MIIYTIIITVALIATIKRYKELNKKYLLQQGTIFTLETRNNKVLEKLKELESWKAPHKSKSNDNFFKNIIDYKDGYFYADLAADDEVIYLTTCPYYITNGCAIYVTNNKMAYTREYKQVLVKNSVNDTEKEYTALKFKRDQFKKFTAAEKSDIYEFSFDVDFNYMFEEAKQKDYILIKEL